MDKEDQTAEGIIEVQEEKFSWKRVICITAIPFFIFISLMTPPIFGANRAGELTRATHNMKQLSIALLQYEQEHGSYPKRIDDLVKKEIISQEFLNDIFQRTPEMVGPWWYQSPSVGLSSSDPADTPLIITPSINGKYAILRIDCAAKQMHENTALQIITDQDSMWVPIMGVRATN